MVPPTGDGAPPPGRDRPAAPERPGSRASLDGLVERLRVPLNRDLLGQALTHRSYAYEHGGLPTNERMEFLGDSVLGLVITDALYRRYPDLSEGQLARLRAAVVNMRALADVARDLGLGGYVMLGRGEDATGGRDKASILSDTLEAVIGAAYLDAGFPVVASLVRRLFGPSLAEAHQRGAGLDWKTSLQELVSVHGLGSPSYVTTDSGPDHAKEFVASVVLGGEAFGVGVGRSKKEAEQQAAERAWHALADRVRSDLGRDGTGDGSGNGGRDGRGDGSGNGGRDGAGRTATADLRGADSTGAGPAGVRA